MTVNGAWFEFIQAMAFAVWLAVAVVVLVRLNKIERVDSVLKRQLVEMLTRLEQRTGDRGKCIACGHIVNDGSGAKHHADDCPFYEGGHP